ncbi:MAG: ribosome recycling factor [Defluviitaleaceae bacterium]|nr:ribosome recycling factor [Defluviitaleaceae bacterium]MCL2239630.1 ribosome recycling factor [Defluviitaleaceae bacterium]
MAKTVSVLESDFETIRVGRANPRVLDKLSVNYYGTPTPLAQVGNITVPEARMLQISPWESNMLKEIEKAIQASDLGLNPTNDGKVIRLTFPELTEERRKQLAKDVKKKAEDAKVAVRNVRRDAVDAFKKAQKKGDVTEDDLKQLETETQNLTDKYVGELDKRVDAKTKEIMTV